MEQDSLVKQIENTKEQIFQILQEKDLIKYQVDEFTLTIQERKSISLKPDVKKQLLQDHKEYFTEKTNQPFLSIREVNSQKEVI